MKKQPEHNRKNVPPQDTAKAPKSAVSRSMRTRAIVLAALFVLVGFGAVVYNLYQLQIVQHDELAARAENQQLADETITPNRGVIYDSDMKVLARSNKVWTVVASPRDMAKSGTNINDVAVKLAELLELDAQSILEKLQKSESNYQLIKRQIEKPVADAITAWITEYNASDKGKDTPVAGISLVQDAKRYYPYQTLASTIIGFVNADGDGVLGIESYYNDTLKGTAGRVVGMKNAWGYDLPNGTYEAAYDAEDGNGLVLTLNASIQSTLEKYLQNAVDEYHVENRAVGIVMDVNTGRSWPWRRCRTTTCRTLTPLRTRSWRHRSRPLRMKTNGRTRGIPRSGRNGATRRWPTCTTPARCSRSSRLRLRWTPARRT